LRPETIPPRVSDMEAPADSSVPRAPTWRRRWRVLRERSAALTLVAFGVVALLLALLLWTTFRTDDQQLVATDVEEAVARALASATPSPVISAQVYQAILPSLVVVQTDNGGEGNGFGIGTGVVVNSDAEVLTALHVIQGATEIQLAFADGTRTSATVTNVDPERDIAVLTPAVLPNFVIPATIGSSSAMRVGDEVFAVGNPLGLVGSLSAGVVSGLDRESTPPGREDPLRGLIQFDAAVNPGNSGGPLLDRRGQVVGIVTGLINPTEQDVFIGIGFAVPIDAAVSAAGGPAQ
jgi:S1-C subfamily serine protease